MSFRILEAGRCPLRVAGRPAFWSRFHTARLRPTCVLVQGRRTLAHESPGCVPLTCCSLRLGGRPIPCSQNGRAPHPIPRYPPSASLSPRPHVAPQASFRATSCAWEAVCRSGRRLAHGKRYGSARPLPCVFVAFSLRFAFPPSHGRTSSVPPRFVRPHSPLPSAGHDPVRPSLHLAFKR